MLGGWNVGSHNYYYHTQNNVTLLLTISDCEYIESRRFINNTPDHLFQQLSRAVFETIWIPNRYNIQNQLQFNYIFGQAETQEFITHVAAETNFFGRLPMDLICISSIGIYPYHDLNARIEIEIGFGSAREFHTNSNPASA